MTVVERVGAEVRQMLIQLKAARALTVNPDKYARLDLIPLFGIKGFHEYFTKRDAACIHTVIIDEAGEQTKDMYVRVSIEEARAHYQQERQYCQKVEKYVRG
jgi:hypothetical protein